MPAMNDQQGMARSGFARWASVLGLVALMACTDGDGDGRADRGQLAVQTARSGSMAERGGRLIVELHEASPWVVVFADRPQRFALRARAEVFARLWKDGSTFALDPPNAALVLGVGERTRTGIVEILTYEFDPTRQTLQMEIAELESGAIPLAPESTLPRGDFEDVSIFIDGFPTFVNDQITDSITSTASGTSVEPRLR